MEAGADKGSTGLKGIEKLQTFPSYNVNPFHILLLKTFKIGGYGYIN